MGRNALIDWLICALIALAAWCGVAMADAQTPYNREGDNFELVQKERKPSEPIKTKYTFTRKGKKYPVYITKNGACYIETPDTKSGKTYLKAEIRDIICKEMGIEHKTRKSVK